MGIAPGGLSPTTQSNPTARRGIKCPLSKIYVSARAQFQWVELVNKREDKRKDKDDVSIDNRAILSADFYLYLKNPFQQGDDVYTACVMYGTCLSINDRICDSEPTEATEPDYTRGERRRNMQRMV